MPGDASVAVDYRYEIVDNDGTPLQDIPLTCTGFEDVLSNYGQLDGTLPLTHPKASRGVVDPPGREIVVTRNGVVAWNGPITYLRRSKREQLTTIRAQQLTWYLYNATLDEDYTATSTDLFDIVRDLIDIATGKTNGSRFAFTVSSGSAGATATVDYKAAYRYRIGKLIQDLANDPSNGFDFRLDVAGSGAGDITRQITLGAPAIGTTVVAYKLEPGNGTDDLIEELDIERGGNVVHVLPGFGPTLTRTNTGSLGAGDPSIEYVLNRPDLDSAKAPAPGVADELRRKAQPPVRAFTASYVPRAGVPYNWCDLGDLVGLQDADLQIDATRRVLSRKTVPPREKVQEHVDLALSLPLDDLGT